MSVLTPPALIERAPRRSIDEVLAATRKQLVRVTPAEARSAWSAGAVVVDIRLAAQ